MQEHLTLLIDGLLLLEIPSLPLVFLIPLSHISPPTSLITLSFSLLHPISPLTLILCLTLIFDFKKRSTEKRISSSFYHFITNLPCLFVLIQMIYPNLYQSSIPHFFSDLPKDLSTAIIPPFLYH